MILFGCCDLALALSSYPPYPSEGMESN